MKAKLKILERKLTRIAARTWRFCVLVRSFGAMMVPQLCVEVPCELKYAKQ